MTSDLIGELDLEDDDLVGCAVLGCDEEAHAECPICQRDVCEDHLRRGGCAACLES